MILTTYYERGSVMVTISALPSLLKLNITNNMCNKAFNIFLPINIITVFILLGIIIYYKVTPKSFDTFQEAINTYTYKELDSIVYCFRTKNLEELIENQVNKELDSIQHHYIIKLQESLIPISILEDYFHDLSNKYPHLSRIRYDVIANKVTLYWIDNERIQKRKEREMNNPKEREYRIKNIDTIRYKNYYFYKNDSY